jgi:hypothetical protein
MYRQTNSATAETGRVIQILNALNGAPDPPVCIAIADLSAMLNDKQRQALGSVLRQVVEFMEAETSKAEQRQLARVLAHLPADLRPVFAELDQHAGECYPDGCAGWWEANAA